MPTPSSPRLSLKEERMLRYTLADFTTKPIDPNAARQAMGYSNVPVAKPVTVTPQVSVDKSLRAPSSYNTSNLVGVPAGYNINLDPTYSGTIGADTGYTGAYQSTAGNVGPTGPIGDALGKDWASGNPMAALEKRAEEYANGAVPNTAPSGGGRDLAGEAAAKQAALAAYWQKVAADTALNADLRAQAQERAASAAAGVQESGKSTVASILTPDGQVNQTVVETMRQQGISDSTIRDAIMKQRQGQHGFIAKPATGTTNTSGTPPPATGQSTGQSTTSTNGAGTTTGQKPPPSTGGTQTQGGATGQEAGTTTQTSGLMSPNALRTMAAKETNPGTQLGLLMTADWLEKHPDAGDPMSFQQYQQSDEALALMKGFDATDKWLDNMDSYSKKAEARDMAFLESKNQRDNKFLAQQQSNADQMLRFQQEKSARDLSESNRKTLMTMSNSLAFAGGFGNLTEIANIDEARVKGEQNLADLNTEYGFKRADISLQYTQMIQEANDKFASDHNTLSDKFYDRLANISLQGISNDTAKRSAVSSAYKEYKSDIQTAAKTNYDSYMAAAKMVSDTYSEMEKTRQAEAKADLAYERQQKDLDRREETAFDREMRAADRADTRAETAQDKYERNNEIADRKLVKTEFEKIAGRETVKNYSSLRDTQKKITALVADAKANPNDSQKVGAAIQLAMTLTAKGSDPTTGVRDGELAKFGMGQSVIDKVAAFGKKVSGGDLTGITIDMVEAYAQASELLSETQRQEAQAEYAGAINALVEFNTRSRFENINPATITLPSGLSFPDWAVKSYYEDEEAAASDTSFDVDWEDQSTWESNTGTGQAMSGSPYHTGIDEYAIDVDGKIGDPLRSPATGEVVKVVRGDSGLGNYVVVQKTEGSDVFEYTLGHMDQVRVKQGDTINSGIALGTIGNTGNVIAGENGDGSHVHLRITKNGKPYNPRKKAIASL